MFRFLRQGEREKTEHAVQKTRKTWFGRMATVFQRQRLDPEMWDQLEELLIGADVGVPTSAKLITRLKDLVREANLSEPGPALDLLKSEMVGILDTGETQDLLVVDESPLIILMVGVNGVGKTTSIAKLASSFKADGKQVVLGAADTFRAAAIEQLQAWGSRLDIAVIAHKSGADPAAVAFDTYQAADSRDADVVIIDTAGRLHTKHNLMEELKKIQRVLSRNSSPDSQKVLLTLDATTGQNGLAQARSFVDAVKCDGVFLAKLDGTAKGGVVLAIAEELGLPVLYIGTGEQPDDIAIFDPTVFVDMLFAPADE